MTENHDKNRSEQQAARRLMKETGWKYTKALRHIRSQNPDTDPIVITHEQDPSLDGDEMMIHTTIDPESIRQKEENAK